MRLRRSLLAALILAGSALAAPPAGALSRLVATTESGRGLVTFRSDGRAVTNVRVSGLRTGEAITGLDVRSSTGALLATTNGDRLYAIALRGRRASATRAGSMTPAPLGEFTGFDVNPAVDRLRFVTDANENLRLLPDTGAVAARDGAIAYAAGDTAAGIDPSLVAMAYTNPDVNPATGTLLYGIDAARDALVIQDPPNNGTLRTVGRLRVDAGLDTGFDIAPDGTPYALIAPARRRAGLYRIDLASGLARRAIFLPRGAGTASLAVLR